MRDFSVHLTHRPGELARVAAVLSQHCVNLKAIVGLALGKEVIVRFIPHDLEAARAAFDSAAIRFEESEIVQVLLENRAGELAMVSSKLAGAGVNLRAIYLTGVEDNLVELAIASDNVAHTRRLLG